MNNNSDTLIPRDKKDLSSIFKKYIVPCILLVILTLIVSWIAYQRVQIQIIMGPGWDTYAFLANALEFAGRSIGYSEPHRPPFLSLLTSIFFSLGEIHESVIFYVDATIFVFGVIGLYLFLKLRFDTIQSFIGSLIFASSPVVLSWLATGYTDLASVSLSIWSLYLMLLGVQKDGRFFYLAFPMAMMAFLTRYTAGLILFPMIFYIIISGKYLQNFKKMFLGVIISFLIFIPFLILNYNRLGDPFFPFIGFLSSSEGSSALESVGYDASPFYFLINMPTFIAVEGNMGIIITLLLFSILLIGLIIYLYNIINTQLIKKRVKSYVHKILEIKNNNTKIKVIFLLLFLFFFLLTFNRVSFFLSELIFLIFIYLSYNLTKGISNKIEVDLMVLCWFITYFIFHSTFLVKVDRYFITMLPAFSYFIVLGLDSISSKLKLIIKNINLSSWILSVLLMLLILYSSFSFLDSIPQEPNPIVDSSKNSIEWLKEYDSNYTSKVIYSDVWPTFSWYLETDVQPMPAFKDSRAFNHELQKNNADYYFTLYSNRNLSSYEKIYQSGKVTLYEKNPERYESKPLMLYIGKNWQNYIEDVLDFKAFVLYRGGRFGLGEVTIIDSHSLEELKKYPYILLYNFKWNDQKVAEEMLFDYVNSGGTLVIDLSANLDGVYYNLDNSIFLDTIITKKRINNDPDIWISPELELQNKTFSSFISEGNSWNGANYESYGNNKIDNLVTADGNTLIGIQKVGKGKIIWIGYNFVWHAFYTVNLNEKQLIQKVIFEN